MTSSLCSRDDECTDQLRDRARGLPALALDIDGAGRHADHGGRSDRRPARRLRAEAELLRPRRRHRAARRRCSGCGSSTPRCKASSSPAGSTRCSARARTSRCSRRRPTPTRSTSASSRTRPATASRRCRPSTPARSWLAAVNGTAAGGGYELALACDEIVLVDDRSSAVSLPEVPLLAVLPGTGGLTAWSTSATCGATSPTCSPPRPRASRASRQSSGVWSTRRAAGRLRRVVAAVLRPRRGSDRPPPTGVRPS